MVSGRRVAVRTRRKAQGAEGTGEIERLSTTRTSSSVYISDAERDTLRAAGGTKNLSKAIQRVAKTLSDLRR